MLGSERYVAERACVWVELTVSRMTGGGYALRLCLGITQEPRLAQPCARRGRQSARKLGRPLVPRRALRGPRAPPQLIPAVSPWAIPHLGSDEVPSERVGNTNSWQ